MNPRISLTVAVVGALLVGGAATGTTRASWTEEATAPGASVDSGRMGFSVSSPSSLTALEQSGSSAGTSTFTVTDTSAGRNLVQRVTATVTGLPAGITAQVAASCAAAPQPATSVDLSPGGSAALCLTVTSSGTAASGDVTIELAGTQLPTGWSTTIQTVTLPVTVNVPAAGALVLRCGVEVGGLGHSIEWDAVPGADGYSIYQAGSAAGPFGAPIAVGTGLSHTATGFAFNENRYLRVTAVVNGVESAPSNVLRVRHNGKSDNMGCGPA